MLFFILCTLLPLLKHINAGICLYGRIIIHLEYHYIHSFYITDESHIPPLLFIYPCFFIVCCCVHAPKNDAFSLPLGVSLWFSAGWISCCVLLFNFFIRIVINSLHLVSLWYTMKSSSCIVYHSMLLLIV